jgi:hypothetical protein
MKSGKQTSEDLKLTIQEAKARMKEPTPEFFKKWARWMYLVAGIAAIPAAVLPVVGLPIWGAVIGAVGAGAAVSGKTVSALTSTKRN